MPIRLSICIPTYNRARFLPALLDSLLDADLDEIHVAISDNASTDNTEEVIEPYRARFPHFDYRRNDSNLGPDRNYLAAADMAKGEYGIIMGSDDAFCPGAMGKIFCLLDRNPDIVAYNVVHCAYDMTPMFRSQFATFSAEPAVLEIRNEDDIVEYLGRCHSIAAAFSYLSSIIFKVERWRAYSCPDVLIGSAYPHSGILFMMMRDGCRFIYTHDWLVRNRGSNDSFHPGDMYSRILLDLNGYDLLAKTIFGGQDRAGNALRRLAVREVSDWNMRYFSWFLMRKIAMSSAEWSTIVERLRSMGPLSFKFRLFNALTPDWLLGEMNRAAITRLHRVAKRVKHKLRQIRWAIS